MNDFSRRAFLQAGAAAALVRSSGAAAALGVPGTWQPFPLGSVRLGPGLFQEQADTNARYLDSLSVDRLLHSFRITAGISSSATPYRGWEDPNCELRGHFNGGHFLSAVALAAATSANSDLGR